MYSGRFRKSPRRRDAASTQSTSIYLIQSYADEQYTRSSWTVRIRGQFCGRANAAERARSHLPTCEREDSPLALGSHAGSRALELLSRTPSIPQQAHQVGGRPGNLLVHAGHLHAALENDEKCKHGSVHRCMNVRMQLHYYRHTERPACCPVTLCSPRTYTVRPHYSHRHTYSNSVNMALWGCRQHHSEVLTCMSLNVAPRASALPIESKHYVQLQFSGLVHLFWSSRTPAPRWHRQKL